MTGSGEIGQRREPGWEAPEGYVHAYEPDPRWRLLHERESYRCLWREVGERCENPAVAAIERGHHRNGSVKWGRYCADHMYGRWIESGVVMHWVVVPEAAEFSGSTEGASSDGR